MECERKNKWWRGCRFEARYDSKLPDRAGSIKAADPSYLEAYKDKTYVCDVCVTCGKVVKREEV